MGHLFQNRYKSIVVEEEPYLLELVRYLHLNPLRAKIVCDLRHLDRYPWSGHSALLGTVARPWQATAAILDQFGPTPSRARRAYRAFIVAGIPQGRRPEFQGRGLLRSLGGWTAVATLRRGREAYAGDERVLGSSAFVEQLRREVEPAKRRTPQGIPLEALVSRVCRHVGIPPASLHGGGRRPMVTRAREGIAYLWLEVCGRPGRPLGPVLGLHPAVVYKAARRGVPCAAEWQGLLAQKR